MMHQNHALPLMAPMTEKMTMHQCDAAIAELKETHRHAIEDFWKKLKRLGDKPDATWNKTQLDLYRLYRLACARLSESTIKGFDGPTRDDVHPIWRELIKDLDHSVRARMQMPEFHVNMELVAIMTRDDDIVLVHRYQSDHLHDLGDDDLTVRINDGAHWYYRTYECGFDDVMHRGSSKFACLYTIGVADKETDEWTPLAVGQNEISQIWDAASDMESLRDRGSIDAHSMPLLGFPSGFEARIIELREHRIHLSSQAAMARDAERSVINAAQSTYIKPIEGLRAKLHAAETDLSLHLKNMETAKLQAFVKFYGLACGQHVKHASKDDAGILTITDVNQPQLIVQVPGKESPRWCGSSALQSEIRLGEWSVVAQPCVS